MPPKRMLLDERLYVQISTIPNAGKGLFALVRIPSASIIGDYIGETLPLSSMHDTTLDRDYFIQTLPYYHLTEKRYYAACIIDGKTRLNKMRWINDPRYDKARRNAIVKQTGDGRLIVVALRSIRPGEEILMSYGEDYWKAEEQASLNKWLDY